jgi:DNA primase
LHKNFLFKLLNNMTVTQEIKERLDIVDIVGESVQLRRAGRRFTGFCPFHQNTRTPSFFVFPETQTWHCFGACAEGGDVFSFVMKRNAWDFTETLKHLAQRAGVELQPQTPQRKEQQAVEERLGGLLTLAADYFNQLLLYAPQAEQARRYLADRSLSAETIDTFKIGFALNSWDAASTHFQSSGYSRDELLAVGLLTENEDKGTSYDRFRHRIIIPIRNVSGQVVGFGARTLDKDGIPKYLNSPQTVMFDKSRLLFGLDLAKRHIREAHVAVVVEGYMDVLQAWQHGFHNVVAQMGTALTEAQLQLLKRQTKRFVIALDADAAGAKATLRSLEVARETLDREMDFAFDARGLVRHEGRLKADIRVATLPAGQDPDDIIRNDPEQWNQIIANAKPTVAYVIDVLTRDIDLSDAKVKSATVHRIAPLIRDIPDAIERDHYWQLLGRKLNIDSKSIRQVATKKPTSRKSNVSHNNTLGSGRRTKSEQGSDYRQANFLGHCLTYPQLVMLVDRRLQTTKQRTVSEQDFEAIEDKILWQHMRTAQFDAAPSVDELQQTFDQAVAERARQLMQLSMTDPVEADRLPDVLTLSVLSWRLDSSRKLLDEVKYLIESAKQNGDDETRLEHTHQWQTLALDLRAINQARHNMSAMSRRQAETK